ncbi:hypothetical protein B0G80_2042 [Paraburkholderia sp. BL6669N2]|nr:hypothetical protein B0G80_2042 [Paraburkholderia sp. BL6669N2]
MSNVVIEAFSTEHEALVVLTVWKEERNFLPVGPGIIKCESAGWNNVASTTHVQDDASHDGGDTYLVIVQSP